MPTYEYACDACAHRFEELQSFSEAQLKKCPQCKKNKLQRLIGTGAAILFKGSGFYQTDYRSDTYKTAAKADEAKQTTGKTGNDTKTPPAAAGDATGTAQPSKEKSSEKKAKS